MARYQRLTLMEREELSRTSEGVRNHLRAVPNRSFRQLVPDPLRALNGEL